MDGNNWQQATMEKVLLETIKEQKRTRRWKIFFRFIWLGIIISLIYFFAINQHHFAKEGKHVAVVDLKGVISEENSTYKNVSKGLKEALKDKNTIAVIIRANSPGGSPVYSNMLYTEILRLRKQYPKKPIDVVIEEVCASGCYYIAAGANKIYANPSSIVGSIGVIYTGIGVTGLMQKIGVDSRLLIAGKNKAMGYPLIPVNKEQQLMQQQMLNEVHQQFITAVKNGRGKRLDTGDTELFSGRYWIGEDGIKLGLIDGFASVDSLARDQFKTDKIINYTPEEDPWDKIAKKMGIGLADVAKQAVNSMEFGSFN